MSIRFCCCWRNRITWGKIPLTTLKLLTMGKNTTNHPQVTDHGEKYHWPPLSYWPWGKIPLTSLKLLTMGKNTTDLPQVTDHGENYHWPPSSYWPWGKIPLTTLKLLTSVISCYRCCIELSLFLVYNHSSVSLRSLFKLKCWTNPCEQSINMWKNQTSRKWNVTQLCKNGKKPVQYDLDKHHKKFECKTLIFW